MTFIILTALFCKQYYVNPNNLDKVCLAFGVLGILLLLFVSDKFYAICLAILIDFVAVLPTLFKVWFDPNENDDFWRFAVSCFMKILSLLTFTTFTFANSGFTIYAAIITFAMSIFILIKKTKRI